MHSSRMRSARFSAHLWGGESAARRRQKVEGVGSATHPQCEQTDACGNITLPQTSFAGGTEGLASRRLKLSEASNQTV